MALIKCSNCEKMISDKATTCPQCGTPVSSSKAETSKTILCEECNSEISEGMLECPNCGCPIEKECQPLPKDITVSKSKNMKFLFLGGLLVIIAVFAYIFVSNNNKNKYNATLENYYSTYTETVGVLLDGASKAESAANLIHDVWYNAIYEIYGLDTDKYTRSAMDFNEALNNLFSDEDFINDITAIEKNQQEVAELMKQLREPPEEYKEAHKALQDLYDAYTSLTNLAVNPTGSLQIFTQNFDEADNNTYNCYEKVMIYID